MKVWDSNRVGGYGKWLSSEMNGWTPEKSKWKLNWVSPLRFIIISVIISILLLSAILILIC